MDTYRPTVGIYKPAAYVVPKQWRAVIDRLEASGVQLERLPSAMRMTVWRDSIVSFTTVPGPYEGHYLHRAITTSMSKADVTAHAGDVLVRTGRHTDRFVMEVLEPRAEDSYFAWNFFDAMLQQKEWFSDYVFEDIAADLLEKDPRLKAALQEKREADTEFAADAWAQLLFIYQRSPYFERSFREYPVLRLMDLPTELR